MLRDSLLKKECAVIAKEQTAGIGSRNNSWKSNLGDLTFSFIIKKDNLPKDLPISSASIFFAFLFKEILHEFDKECWLKWPNDIYKKNKKVGGVITQFLKNHFVVGIGLNLSKKEEQFGYLEINKNVNNMLDSYFMLLKKSKSWQEVFSKFKVEFEKQKNFEVHVKGKKTSLKYAKLCDDGALLVNNERVYSLR